MSCCTSCAAFACTDAWSLQGRTPAGLLAHHLGRDRPATGIVARLVRVLYHLSGWTQDELAKVEGCNQKTVQRRILFGRFLSFRPDGLNAKNLTEGRFRSYWEASEKNLNKRVPPAREGGRTLWRIRQRVTRGSPRARGRQTTSRRREVARGQPPGGRQAHTAGEPPKATP